MENGTCIKPSQCGCLMTDGTYYQNGEKRTNNNCTESCTCSSSTGQLGCTKIKCSEDAFCGFKNDDFSCHCKDGYMGDGINCKDIDECSLIPLVCDKNAICNNSDGSYSCTCEEGFERNGFNCTNINECFPKPPCENDIEDCFDKIPGYECLCKEGFMRNTTTGKCEDKNECLDTGNLCNRVSTNCNNTFGSYRCECKYGFRPNPTDSYVCIDVNECFLVHDCDKNFAKCTNTPGSYYCTCFYGYQGDGKNCTDIDECKSSLVCQRPDSSCVNLPGSYECRCLDGKPGCDGPNPCDNVTCIKSHELCYFGLCVCARGYQRNFTTNLCVDVDECSTNSSDCSNRKAVCVNLEGSFECDCLYGYKMNANTGICEDIDECKEDSHRCGAYSNCINTDGGYFCQCQDGFTGHCDECRDIDECSINENNCDKTLANCFNSIGSYRCECKDGYQGDGKICIDIDECSTGMNNCTDPKSSCLNIDGSYTCSCTSGYDFNLLGKCVDVDECNFADNDCDENADCINQLGTFTCKCKNGFLGSGTECNPEEGRTLCNKVLCPLNSICNNVTCICKSGFISSGEDCIDIDECNTTVACDPNADCINVHSSYICVCKDGFIGNGHNCLNLTNTTNVCQFKDFCIDGDCYGNECHCPERFSFKNNRCYDERCKNACPFEAVCSTSSGSTVCSCPSGTSMSPDGSQCSDIDECTENYDDCQTNSLCRNIYGFYTCTCPSDYLDVFGDGKVCKHVEKSNCNLTCSIGQYCKDDHCTCFDDLVEKIVDNEISCQKELPSCNENTCPPNANCEERLYGFLCNCIPGYQSTGLKSCKDIDECNLETDNCSNNEQCINTLGSFSCSCKPGYSLDNTTGECSLNSVCNCGKNGLCDQDDKCICNPGYELDSSGKCTDINECLTESPCHILAQCTNTPGSYECNCPDKYYGDPTIRCVEDKCATKQLICADDEQCITGIYNSVCIKIKCQSNEIMLEKSCVSVSKACQTKVCDTNAVCKVENGRTDCFCDSGYVGDGESCEDINECSTGIYSCPVNSHCQNKPGSYYCACDSGFIKSVTNTSTEYCVDINECNIINSCAPNAKCTNQDGSFLCQCNDGYIGDGRYSCRLDDKCHKFGRCHSYASCILDDITSLYTCKCKSGYSGDGVTSCIKMNLCSKDGTSKCHRNADCIQSNSTYQCICKSGYQGNGYDFCSDIDECAQSNSNNCLPTERCVNSMGSYSCVCGKGSIQINEICQDIDECSGTGKSNCSSYAICTNKNLGYNCQCKDGFYGDGVICMDINECKLGISTCDSQSLCTNKPGSFDCECQAGTIDNGTTCVDQNECSIPKNSTDAPKCDDNATCKDKQPGYECICNVGFLGTGWFCVKESPCNKPNACSINETCSPSNDSTVAVCQCKDGFTSTNSTCLPIKACETGIATCDKNTEDCVQLDPGYACACKPGFKKVGDTCQDKNECDPQSPDFAAQECSASGGGCINTPGSFICSCTQQQQAEGNGCKPIDPCASNLNTCNKNVENCVNNGDSGYTCNCNPGYTKVDGICTDINECADKTDECKNNATCVNTVGSYNCTCPATLKLDINKKSCTDRNECEENPLICGDYAKCVNSEGSFSCACIPGYQWNGTNCEDIDECKNLTHPCHVYAECSNIPGSCTCKCRPGYNGNGIYKCEEDDRCPPNIHVSCQVGTYCSYQNGIATCACKTGYSLIETISCNDTVCLNECSDINECITKTAACHPLAKCTNNDGAYHCECPSYLTGDGKTICEDKNECALGEHMCDLNTSYCINNNNSNDILQPFQCTCFQGYMKIPETELCVNKDECLNPNDNDCDLNAECIDTFGSYICKCNNGFKSAPERKCLDINECEESIYTCDIHSKCNNTIGSYKCDCDSGYQLSLNDSLICEDIDECVSSLTCINLPNTVCVNNPGSFECVCKNGFVKQGGECKDLDECQNITSCKNGSICVNTLGDFSCKCKVSQRQLPDGSCESVNECLEQLDHCKDLNGPESTCYDLQDEYGCTCPSGYKENILSPKQCVDIDECSTNTHNCAAASSTCKNTYGSFKCNCNSGFQKTSNGTCIDLNECKTSINICNNGKCINNVGGYMCQCKYGFNLVNGQCLDIDECTIDRISIYADTCDRTNGYCSNKIGGYSCSCQQGFKLSNNSHKCEDVDECSYPNSCLNGVCNNNPGSFDCICLKGFKNVNGKCTDIDECTKNSELCGTPTSSFCINTPGSYKCSCSQGYDNSGGKITNECLPINECIRLNVTCPINSQCMDQDLGYQCLCKDGYKEDQIGICRNIDECQIEDSCHYLANCVDTDGSFECTCKTGYTGDGKMSCTSICNTNSCPPNQICKVINNNQFECGCSCQGPRCSNEGHVCDINGVTFVSERDMLETACKQNKTTNVNYFHDCKDSCKKVICPITETCTMVESKPSCICAKCTDEETKETVFCSNNGLQFQTLCQMKTWICETKAFITKSYDGPCRRPIDCRLSSWSEWTGCSRTCGVGSSSRSREITKAAKYNGKCDASTIETQSCSNGPCPGDPCENLTCNPGSFCDSGKCVCPDCSGITSMQPVCGKIGDSEAGSYRSYCTFQHNACILNSTYTYIHSGYCGDHIPSEPKICTVVTNFQIVNNTNNCTSVEPVRTNLCSGGCGLNASYCCRPLSSRILRVKFRCLDSSFIFDQVKAIASCECKLEERSSLMP